MTSVLECSHVSHPSADHNTVFPQEPNALEARRVAILRSVSSIPSACWPCQDRHSSEWHSMTAGSKIQIPLNQEKTHVETSSLTFPSFHQSVGILIVDLWCLNLGSSSLTSKDSAPWRTTMVRRGEVETLVTLIRWQPWPVAIWLGFLFSRIRALNCWETEHPNMYVYI